MDSALNCTALPINTDTVWKIQNYTLPSQNWSLNPPLEAKANTEWTGLDGLWTTFEIGIGSSNTTIQVLPSTSGFETWLADYSNYTNGAGSTYASDNDKAFISNESATWIPLPCSTVPFPPQYNIKSNASYGLDSIELACNTSECPDIKYQIIGHVANLSANMLGIEHWSGNLTPTAPELSRSIPSFLALLRQKNFIPSLSWSYTAGAYYRGPRGVGSLIFGGYDLSRYIPNDLIFDYKPNVDRNLLVNIQSIGLNTSTSPSEPLSASETRNLLPSPVIAHIDSLFPYLMLPQTVCDTFASVLNLTWNSTYNHYLLSEDEHRALLIRAPSFNFTLTTPNSNSTSISITFPYDAFSLQLSPPYFPISTYYFPLLPSSTPTLGRVFLQEAYLTVDYDHSIFHVSALNHKSTPAPSRIFSIYPGRIGCGYNNCIIGSSIGAALVIVIITGLIVCIWQPPRWRRYVRWMGVNEKERRDSDMSGDGMGGDGEMGGGGWGFDGTQVSDEVVSLRGMFMGGPGRERDREAEGGGLVPTDSLGISGGLQRVESDVVVGGDKKGAQTKKERSD
ncbi:MAG: hypothetical protein M1814_002781 [Vezdaea aestivalis]|nr:MAG: hypothetical protein M1814_002781 [Vezdaea aestivalis]